MVKFVIAFKQPAQPEAFENAYQDFLALVERMPDIQRKQVLHVVGSPRGQADYYRLLELYFADLPTLEQSLASSQGQEAARELSRFEPHTLEAFLGHVYEA